MSPGGEAVTDGPVNVGACGDDRCGRPRHQAAGAIGGRVPIDRCGGKDNGAAAQSAGAWPFGHAGAASALGEGETPVGRRNPAILYGLGNILENAVDFAESRVTVTLDWNAREVEVVVADDGPGFSSGVLERLGEPWVTTRERLAGGGDGEGGDLEGADAGGGLGLGFFIAQTFLMRSGAKVACDNKPFPEHGAEIRILWPRSLWMLAGEGVGSSNFTGLEDELMRLRERR